VRSDRDEPGGERIPEGAPAHRTIVGVPEPPLLFDERGCEIQRHWQLILFENGQRVLDHVGGSVVERDDDCVVVGERSIEPSHGVVEIDDPSAVSELGHLLIECSRIEIDFPSGSGPYSVIDQDGDAGRSWSNGIDGPGRMLQSRAKGGLGDATHDFIIAVTPTVAANGASIDLPWSAMSFRQSEHRSPAAAG